MNEFYVELSKTRRVYVYTALYMGKEYNHIREFYFDKEKNEWSPTKRGVAIPKEKYSDLMYILNKAEF